MVAFFTTSAFTAASGANTSSDVVGIHLPRNGRLWAVWIGITASEGPVRVTIDLFPNGRRSGSISLKQGWVRGFTDQAGGGSLKAIGEWPLLNEPEIAVFVRNDTGSTVDVFFQASAESQ